MTEKKNNNNQSRSQGLSSPRLPAPGDWILQPWPQKETTYGIIEKETLGRVLEVPLVPLTVLVIKLHYFSDSVLLWTIQFDVTDHSE